MGRSQRAIRTRDVADLFGFFGIDAVPERVEAHRTEIQWRFAAEVEAISRLCRDLPERVRFKLYREALRLSYESAALRAQLAAR